MNLEPLAEWVASLDPERLPPATAERVRLQIASMVASALDGARLPEVAAARAAWGPEPSAGRRGGRARTAAPDPEVFAPWLAMASIALDFDDYLLFGHTGHSAVTVALATALQRDAAVADLLAATAAANELGGRLGGYTLLGPHNGQLWTHVHLGGAVAAAARIRRDAPDLVARALGLAFAAPPFFLSPAFFGGSAKLLAAALPLRQGLLALRLARTTGLHAPAATLGPEEGLGRRFAHAPLGGFLDAFGETWLSDTLAVKRVPGCAYVSAAAEAAVQVARQFHAAKGRSPVAADVERVELSVTALTAAMEDAARPWRDGPLSALEVNFSAPLTVAVALLDEKLDPASLATERLRRDEAELRTVAGRVAVRHELARTLRLVEGVARPLGLLEALGELPGDGLGRAGWDLLRRYPGILRGGGGGATVVEGDARPFEAIRSLGRLVAGAFGRTGAGGEAAAASSGARRWSLGRARPGDVRFAASAGILATLAGEVYAADCEVPPGAPGAEIDLSAVVREKTARAFADAGIDADAEAFVGRLLGAPLGTPARELFAPVLPALGAG